MGNTDTLIVHGGDTLQFLTSEGENVLLVATPTNVEMVASGEVFELLEVAAQGLPGPPGPTGAPGQTIFAPIADAALSSIATRLDLIDQFTATVSGEGEDPDFLNLYLST